MVCVRPFSGDIKWIFELICVYSSFIIVRISFQLGHYIYVETSWPRKLGQTARLVGGPFSGIMCMRFYYHMYGRHIADLQIYLQDTKSGMENYVWGRYKNQGNTWKFSNATVYGNNYTVRTMHIYFRQKGETRASDNGKRVLCWNAINWNPVRIPSE